MPSNPPHFKHRLDERRPTQDVFALAGVDQDQLAVVLGADVDMALAGDRDAVARAGFDTVDRHPPGRDLAPPGYASAGAAAGDRAGRAQQPSIRSTGATANGTTARGRAQHSAARARPAIACARPSPGDAVNGIRDPAAALAG